MIIIKGHSQRVTVTINIRMTPGGCQLMMLMLLKLTLHICNYWRSQGIFLLSRDVYTIMCM